MEAQTKTKLLHRVAWKHKAGGRAGHGVWTTYQLAKEWAWAGNVGNPKVHHWVEQKPDDK